jgi:hypothetical protein
LPGQDCTFAADTEAPSGHVVVLVGRLLRPWRAMREPPPSCAGRVAEKGSCPRYASNRRELRQQAPMQKTLRIFVRAKWQKSAAGRIVLWLCDKQLIVGKETQYWLHDRQDDQRLGRREAGTLGFPRPISRSSRRTETRRNAQLGARKSWVPSQVGRATCKQATRQRARVLEGGCQ